jgi:hypothetical protein
LSLQRDGTFVEGAEKNEPAVQLDQIFLGEAVGGRAVGQVAPIADDAERFAHQ